MEYVAVTMRERARTVATAGNAFSVAKINETRLYKIYERHAANRCVFSILISAQLLLTRSVNFTLLLHPECPPALSFTHARRTFDRALRSLPGSLHDRVWHAYLRWAEAHPGPAARSVWRRYLKVRPLTSPHQ